MLQGGLVVLVKWVFLADTSVLSILKLIVAALKVLALKLINERLLDCNLLLFFFVYFVLGYAKVNL